LFFWQSFIILIELKVKFYIFASIFAMHHTHMNNATTARLLSRSTVKPVLNATLQNVAHLKHWALPAFAIGI